MDNDVRAELGKLERRIRALEAEKTFDTKRYVEKRLEEERARAKVELDELRRRAG